MSFMLDEIYGLKDIQEFGDCETKKNEWTNKIIDEFINNYKSFSRKRCVSRADKEWAYCLLYEYKSCNMNIDFHNIMKSLCNFYFDGLSVSSNNNNNSNNQFVTNSNKLPKKQDTVPNNSLKNIQYRDQYYIISTINLLMALDNAQLNSNSESNIKNIVLPYIYHIFFILVIIGKELQVQKSVRKIQIEKCPTDTIEGKHLLNKLNNLIKFCSKHSETLIQQPYNVHNSQSIIENYILNAILVYENMVDVDS